MLKEQAAGGPPGRIDPRRLFWLIAAPFASLKLALLAAASLRVRYVMDEFLQASYSLFIPNGFYRGIHDVKTVLYVYYFDIARLLTHDSVSLMRAARLEGLSLALGMVVLVYAIVRNLGRRRDEAFLSACCLLSVSVFMERGFRVRSDTLAVFFSTAVLWWATRPGARGRTWAIVVGAFSALAFLTTQKAVYVVIAVGAGLLASHGRRFLRAAVPAAAGFWFVVLAYAVYFGGLRFAEVVREIFLAPIRNPAIHGTAAYPQIHKYVWVALERNPVAYFVMALGLAAAASHWRSLRPEARFSAAMSATVAVSYFCYDQSWPYVLLWPLPFLATAVPDAVERIAVRFRVGVPAVATGLIAILCLSLPRNSRYLGLSNEEQEHTMSVAESLLQPADRYADGVWMLPTRFQAGLTWWDAATLAWARDRLAHGDPDPLARVFRDEPKVWIMNYRVAALWDYLRPLLRRSYVPVSPGVLLTGTALSPGMATPFENRWRGCYALYDSGGRPSDAPFLLDGKLVRGPVEILPGLRRLSDAGSRNGGPLFLLPAGSHLPGRIPASVQGPDLFAGVYDF